MEQNVLAYLIWLVGALGPTNPKLNALVDRFGPAEEIFFAGEADLAASGLLSPQELAALSRDRKLDGAARVLDRCAARGIAPLTIWDEDYPSQLRTIESPPLLLYMKGKPVWSDCVLNIAVAGTRRMTAYGPRMVRDIVKDLCSCGTLIIGGMSEGIDAAAHRAALDCGGATVALLPCGVDVVYPYANYELYGELAARGCILSEFAPGERVLPARFQPRNRLIAAMSHGVLLAQAPKKSGSLITVKYALQFNREVFAMPGDADVAQSAAPNELISEGAKLTRSAADIIEEFPYIFASVVTDNFQSEKEMPAPGVQLDRNSDEYKVVAVLSEHDADTSTICELTGIPFSALVTMLTEMNIRGIIAEKPGGFYSLSKDVTV